MFIEITPELKELYLDKIKNRLINGDVINHYESCTKTTETYDSENNLISTQKSKSEKRKTTILPTPQHELDLIAKSMSDEEAAKLLMSRGFVVSNPELRPERKSKGISEQTVEDIKKRLLGIEDVHQVVYTEVTESTEIVED
jgi:hypothetical protein